MGWRALIACVFVGGLMACTAKTRNADPGLTATALAPPSPVRIELPFSAEGWRATLETDARELEQLLDRVLAHWPRKEGAGELRLLVLPNPVHAQLWAKQAGLPGDARVPRTHPRARLAVVPMAREDRLMTFRAVPPRTLRETIRHEMAHLFMLDRPGLAEAPLWFHEGLAEAWVGLREIESVSASSHALGACWQSELESEIAKARLQSVEAVDAHTAIADLPAELRYTAWAELVLRLLREHKGERPWELAEARPSLASFLASAPKEAEDPRVSLPGLPRPLGREIDFVAGGHSVLLAAADGETVGLEARSWHGIDPLRLRARVGLTGEPLAEILLGVPGAELCVRVRIDGFGGIVAARESRANPPRRAHYDRLPIGSPQRWREVELRLLRREQLGTPSDLGDAEFGLLVRSGAYRTILPVEAEQVAQPGAPWLLEFRVRSGAFEVVGDTPLVAALR